METKLTPEDKRDIRDILAIERTIMANERTMLAYSRTAMALIIAGLSFLEFTESMVLKTVALCFIPLGVATFIYGFWRFTKKKKAIRTDKYFLTER